MIAGQTIRIDAETRQYGRLVGEAYVVRVLGDDRVQVLFVDEPAWALLVIRLDEVTSPPYHRVFGDREPPKAGGIAG